VEKRARREVITRAAASGGVYSWPDAEAQADWLEITKARCSRSGSKNRPTGIEARRRWRLPGRAVLLMLRLRDACGWRSVLLDGTAVATEITTAVTRANVGDRRFDWPNHRVREQGDVGEGI